MEDASSSRVTDVPYLILSYGCNMEYCLFSTFSNPTSSFHAQSWINPAETAPNQVQVAAAALAEATRPPKELEEPKLVTPPAKGGAVNMMSTSGIYR